MEFSSSFLSSLQVIRKVETWFSSQFFPNKEVSSVISALVLSASSYLFGIGLSVLPVRVFLGFWRGFCLAFSFSEALLPSDRPCSSGICVASNVGFLSKSGRDKKALV